jgi:hypothetical protein
MTKADKRAEFDSFRFVVLSGINDIARYPSEAAARAYATDYLEQYPTSRAIVYELVAVAEAKTTVEWAGRAA